MNISSPILSEVYTEVQKRFMDFNDPAHGWEHVKRVHDYALYIAAHEGADAFIVGIAALLHDIGRIPADGDAAHHAERSATIAAEMLPTYRVPKAQREAIVHAIRAHSFKRGVEPQTLEAKVIRDADRLDALGAVGIMRWAISTSQRRKGQIRNYHPTDPFAEQRPPDEQHYMLDRFFSKLLKLSEGMTTETGRRMAQQRTAFMYAYLDEFKKELEL